MIKFKRLTTLSLLVFPLSFAPLVTAHSLQEAQSAPDNTKTNQRDRDKASPTSDQQKTNDQETTRKIRAAVSKDKSLSTYAHNVKIITQNGKVTLRGPVRSDEEKTNIASKASAVASEGNVDNQLEIAPKS